MQPLTTFHSFGFPYFADAIVCLSCLNDINAATQRLQNTPFFILGEGSNTVFLENYQGTLLKLEIKGISVEERDEEYLVKVGAGENWHQFVVWCLDNHIYGLENLALIPGTVGAAPIQNIGAYGVEVAQFIKRVHYYDIKQRQHKNLPADACEFDYRDSVFKQWDTNQIIVTHVEFTIPKDWQSVTHYGELKALLDPSPQDIFNKVVEIRKEKLPDPALIGNAGSFFKNPIIDSAHFSKLQSEWPSIPSYPLDEQSVKIPAAWLIDQLNFKGKKVGGISCHPQHALVLTNDGSGTGEQLLKLAREIKLAVNKVFSIVLENEVRLVDCRGLIDL